MDTEPKNWLVRTRTGELLGPFSQREMMLELRNQTFSAEDEIAPSQGHWISAQALLNRDSDEFTRTSTRNYTVTQATSATGTVETTNTQKIIPEDLTPTPDMIRPPVEPPIRRLPTASPKRKMKSSAGPIVAGLLGVAGLWVLANQLKPKEAPTPAPEIVAETSAQSPASQATSPFVREIYQLIQAGQTATALERLTRYHEANAKNADLEYLIPYSALLITEGESPARARKFLNQVLTSSNNQDLKAQAHHWLGYLMLSQEERDMGEDHFLEALQLRPKDAAARFNLGRVYLKQKRYKQAFDILQIAELEVPDLWLVHIYKGRAKAAQGLLVEAEAMFKKAIQLSKDRWLAYIYHALFLDRVGQYDQAREELQKMLRRDPNYEINSPPEFGFYQERVNYAEYLSAFNQVMEGGSGEEKEMGKLYISYLLNGPESEEARRIEAVAEKKTGLMAKVLALKVVLDRRSTKAEIQGVLKQLPSRIASFGYYAYVLRGEAKMRTGDLSGARADFSRALTLEPLSAISHWANATLLRKQSRDSEAREKIKTLLTYHPNYIPAIVSSQNF